jgi:hypothetical protein
MATPVIVLTIKDNARTRTRDFKLRYGDRYVESKVSEFAFLPRNSEDIDRYVIRDMVAKIERDFSAPLRDALGV